MNANQSIINKIRLRYILPSMILSLLFCFLDSYIYSNNTVNFIISKKTAYQSEVIEVNYLSDKPVKYATAWFHKKRYRSTRLTTNKKNRYHYQSSIKIPDNIIPGKYGVKMIITLQNGHRYIKNRLITVIKNKPAPVSVKLSDKVLKQGETLKITYLSTQPVRSAAATFSQKTFKAFKKGSSINQFYQFIGMPRSLKPGKYQIKTKVSLKNGRHYINKLNIIIKKGDFVCSKITLKGKANRLNKKTKQLSNEAKILSKKFRQIYKKAFFKRNFIRPAKGKTTTPFGAYRSYNGTFTRKHSGIDIANKKGSSVVAANNGKVTISADFICNGKTIVIDHGMGIQTVYSHLSKRIVKAGKWVKRGELIGLMGSSGISTGSHVHWGLSINNTRVDPQFWLDNPSLYK